MKSTKKTLVLGASPNPARYAYRAIHKLMEYGHPVIALGVKKGSVNGIEIEKPGKVYPDVHTVTLYIGPQRQPAYYDYLISLKPARIIFNPGTENEEFAALALQAGIQTENACTLVLLSTGGY